MKTILLCANGLSGEVIPTIKSWGCRVALISEFPFDVGTSDADAFIEANSKDPKAALYAPKAFFKAIRPICFRGARINRRKSNIRLEGKL